MSGWTVRIATLVLQTIAAAMPFAALVVAVGPDEDPLTVAGLALLVGVLVTLVTTVRRRVPRRDR